MNIEALRAYCLSKPHVTEGFPFDNKTLVFKVCEKMFALVNVDDYWGVNLKCDPEKAIDLRERYEFVRPGYHMSKKHWNSVYFEGGITDQLLMQWIDDSYDLVVQKLPKKVKTEYFG